jgi:hypothetical protein
MNTERLWMLAALTIGAVSGCKNQWSVVAPDASKSASATAAPGATPTQSPEDELARLFFQRLDTVTSPADALVIVKPGMTHDTIDVHNDGTTEFAYWAAGNAQAMFDSDAANETSFALVRKDLDQELGRRMCTSGLIVEIHKQLLGPRKVFRGLLTSGDTLISFWAVGSTGRLVENNRAAFCGFVTGIYDYHNSGGGAGHAVELVGHFRLPENKRSIDARTLRTFPSTNGQAVPRGDVEGWGDERAKPAPAANPVLRRRPNRQVEPGEDGDPGPAGDLTAPPSPAKKTGYVDPFE